MGTSLLSRYVRKITALMGGLQTILAGDFFQLPPVPNKDYGDNGARCFESPIFREVVPHTIILGEVSLACC